MNAVLEAELLRGHESLIDWPKVTRSLSHIRLRRMFHVECKMVFAFMFTNVYINRLLCFAL